MTEIDATIQRLLDADSLREPVLGEVIQSLHLPTGSRGLDIGCGIGLQSLMLARAVGDQGHITGMDIVPEFLAYGENLAREVGLSAQVAFREGDMNRLPFPDESFDWVWSADCAGYPTGDLVPLLKEMMRVLKPRGGVSILGWTSQQVLPGYPLLEARLNAVYSSYLPYLTGKDPRQHFLRALDGFLDAGLEDVKAQTFVGEAQAPLKPEQRAALAALFEMLWTKPALPEADGDWAELQKLCDPASQVHILEQPGYYAFFTYTLFQGSVPRG